MEIATEIYNIREKLRERQEKRIKDLLLVLMETNPVEIGVYGSYARETYKASSDIDIYVIYKKLPSKIEKGDMYELAYEKGIDLLICDEESFYHTDSVFCKNVMKDRKILWRKENYNENE